MCFRNSFHGIFALGAQKDLGQRHRNASTNLGFHTTTKASEWDVIVLRADRCRGITIDLIVAAFPSSRLYVIQVIIRFGVSYFSQLMMTAPLKARRPAITSVI